MSNKPKLSTPQQQLACLEALLFAYGSPVSIKKISSIMEMSEKDTKALLEQFDSMCQQDERGLYLVREGEKICLATKPNLVPFLESLITEEFKEELTPATLETLSLIAYFSPLSRAQIDYVRGVNSAYILRTLLMRGLVEREQKGTMYLYRPSMACLRFMGLSCIEDLPDYHSNQEMKQTMFSESES